MGTTRRTAGCRFSSTELTGPRFDTARSVPESPITEGLSARPPPNPGGRVRIVAVGEREKGSNGSGLNERSLVS